MDIDKSDIQMLATQLPKIFIESSFTFLKTYPKASFASCSLFFSYVFVPSILWFLIYIVPFIVLITAITIHTYISINKGRHARKHDKDGKSPTNVKSTENANTANKKYNAKHGQSVRRRKAKVIFAESSQENIQEKKTISSSNFTSDLAEKRALIEETPKEIGEVEVNVVNDLVNSSPSLVSQDFRTRFNSFMRSQTFGGTATNIEGISSENSDYEGDEPRGDERTAVQWSEDDQKNLADLGLSETERNKRLESLIARRRAQKALSFQFRRAMMDMEDDDPPSHMVHSIEIPNKLNPISPRSCHFTPVSAPPGLTSVKNPFDLPYEPHEEKPNLTGDSFHQEFLGAHQKDMMFGRHERSSSGDIFPVDMLHNLHDNHGTTQEVSERQEKNECQLGEKDDEKKVQLDQSQEAKCDDKVEITDKNTLDQDSEQGPNLNDEDIQIEIKTKSVIVEDYNGRLSYSSSSEENEPISRLDKETILKSLSSPHPRSINIQRGGGRIDDILFDYGSSQTEKTKRADCFYYPYGAMQHTPSHSIASDMHVEVSEFGSPPLLSDGNISSSDDVRSLCDSNFEKEIPDSEDMSITSSQQSRVDANESRSRETCQVSEEDNTGVEYSGVKEEPKIPAEIVNAQDSSNPHPNFVSESKVPGDGDAYKDYTEHIVQEQPTTSCPNSSHGLQPENLPPHGKQLTRTSMTDHLGISDLHNPQNNSQENLITNEEIDISISCMQEERDLPDPSHAESGEYPKATIVDGSVGEGSQPTCTREAEEISEEMVQQMDIPDSLSTEGNYIVESTTHTEDEASSIARSTSELRQFIIQPNEVIPEPELLTEQVPTASSTSSSPKSVLNPRFSGDQGHISYISDVVQMENQHSGGESSSSNSSSSPAQNAAPLAENLTTFPPLESRIEREQIQKEQSNSQLVSAEESASTSGSLSINDTNMDSTNNVQKEPSGTSFVDTNIRNQESNLDTTSSNGEETVTIHREGRL